MDVMDVPGRDLDASTSRTRPDASNHVQNRGREFHVRFSRPDASGRDWTFLDASGRFWTYSGRVYHKSYTNITNQVFSQTRPEYVQSRPDASRKRPKVSGRVQKCPDVSNHVQTRPDVKNGREKHVRDFGRDWTRPDASGRNGHMDVTVVIT